MRCCLDSRVAPEDSAVTSLSGREGDAACSEADPQGWEPPAPLDVSMPDACPGRTLSLHSRAAADE